MNLFFQIQNLQLLIFCLDDQEFMVNLDYVLFMFFCNITKVNHFLHCFIILLHLISSFSHTKLLLVSYAYVSNGSIDHILLSLFALNEFLLTSLVNILCFLLLNLCCSFNINLFFVNSLCISLQDYLHFFYFYST